VDVFANVNSGIEIRRHEIKLTAYCKAGGWTATEFVVRGITDSKDRRPPLDAMLRECKRRKDDVVVRWRLDRLARNLRDLIMLVDEPDRNRCQLYSLAEDIDATSRAGRLQLHVLAAIAEFERCRLRERVMAGLARARAAGVRLGRPRREIDSERLASVAGLPRGRPWPRCAAFQRAIRQAA
jgi:DNA invertase Pin-like site-specific DNA recombinase